MSALDKAKMAGYPRGARRNAARRIAKGYKKPFREVWEQVYRLPLSGPFPHLVGPMPRPLPKHVAAAMSNGLMLHPTKGWRTAAGLPLSKHAEAA